MVGEQPSKQGRMVMAELKNEWMQEEVMEAWQGGRGQSEKAVGEGIMRLWDQRVQLRSSWMGRCERKFKGDQCTLVGESCYVLQGKRRTPGLEKAGRPC